MATIRRGVRCGLAWVVVLAVAATAPGAQRQLSEQDLGLALASLGLEPTKDRQRYDFIFKAEYQGQPWELSMSAVLSQNGEAVWLMAWLDELPASAGDVPQTALLRLLAHNDRLGKGKFFAYVAGNRRFVLQRVVENHDVPADVLRAILLDLGASVVETFPHWSVANWQADGHPQPAPQIVQPVTATAPAIRMPPVPHERGEKPRFLERFRR